MIRNLFSLLTLLVAFTQCTQVTSKSALQLEHDSNQNLRSGLKIEYKVTRGQGYTDNLGTKYSLRYIPAVITNDSTVPIHIQIAFLKEYDYPSEYEDKQFKVFPMPKEWALDGVGISDSTYNDLPNYINNPSLSKTLKPGEEWLLAFGTLYPRRINYGVFPMAVFPQNNRAFHHWCDNVVVPDESPNAQFIIELNIGFTSGSQASPESCSVISFGEISYPKD